MKIIVTDPYTPEALARLRVELNCDIVHCPKPHAEKPLIVEGRALLVRSGTKVDESLLRAMPELRAVVTATTGYDHIDIKTCHKRGVAVIHTPEANRESAAELAIWLMLTTIRKSAESTAGLRSGTWRQSSARGQLITGKTLGIIGLGRIGSRVCELANAFNMKVLAYDPYIADEKFQLLRAEKTGLSELLRLSDIVTLHVPLTAETHRLINSNTLEQMPSHAVIINTSRGGVIDENALAQALLNGYIAAAGLDVFESEPISPQSRLLQLPQLVLTPHIGAYTEEAFLSASKMAVDRLVAFFKDQPVAGLLTEARPTQELQGFP